MGANIDKRPNGCIFVDLDGTLCVHNYNPEVEEDELIYNTYARLLNYVGKGYHIIITTSRSKAHLNAFLERFPDVARFIAFSICDLGTGPRVIINDHKKGESRKAHAISLVRDTGCTEEELA